MSKLKRVGRHGHASKPSRFYSFGAKPPVSKGSHAFEKNPAKRWAGADLVEQQMSLAFDYKNQIIEIEQERRLKVDAALAKLSPELAAVEAALSEAVKITLAADIALMKARAAARKQIRPPELAEPLAAARKAQYALENERGELRKALFATEAWKVENEPIEARNKEERLIARNTVIGAGLYWGTCGFIADSMEECRKGAPPKKAFWNGNGHLALQLQPKGGKGKGDSRQAGKPLLVNDAFACTDTRLRVEPVPSEAWLPGGRHLRKTKVWIRIGSDGTGNKIPIWAVIPIVLHRPMPLEAEIKWVHIIRRRIARKCEWSVQFVLSADEWTKPDCATSGTVGIDVGWRMMRDDSLRVAKWTGDDGEKGGLCLPADWMAGMKTVRECQSIRDLNFNDAKETLSEWMKTVKNPDWLVEATASLHSWKSKSRLASLVWRWKANRFEADGAMLADNLLFKALHEQDKKNMFKLREKHSKSPTDRIKKALDHAEKRLTDLANVKGILDLLEAWRKRDLHLYEYEGNLRDQLQSRRENIYRKFAADMRRLYRTAKIEKLDLTKFHKLPDPEKGSIEAAIKEHVRDACLSIFFQCCKESFKETQERPAEYTTMTCYRCGHVADFDRRPLFRECPACLTVEDQDEVASVNILRS